jgi:sugar O-acyltransferase (sialic acid O-acetyltransferase NeuD family)
MVQPRTILVGGGGFCRELLVWGADCVAAGTLPPIGGYIDDTGDQLAKLGYDLPWLGSITDYFPGPQDNFVLAIGSPAGKRAIHGTLSVRGGSFPKLIHPTARIAPTAQLAEGCIFLLMGVAGPETRIERFVTVNGGSGIGHDGTVGEFTTLSSHVDVTGGAHIGRDAMIGSKALLMPKVRIGDGATVGAGSVVYRSVPAGATVFANPAKVVRFKRPGSEQGR